MNTLVIGKVRGNMWYVGDGVTGSSTTAAVFPESGVTKAYVGDLYLHLEPNDDDNGHVYQCTLKGNASTAKWVYVGNIIGPMPDLCDELTSTSTTMAATANAVRKLKNLIDTAGIYPKEISFNYTETDYSMSLTIENISTTITITDSDGNEGTHSYTKAGNTDDVTVNINIGQDIGYVSEGAVVVKVASSAAAIKNAKLYGNDGLVCDITPNMWGAVNELAAEIKPGATITGGSGDDAYSYRAGNISKKIAGVLTALFPVTHAKAVWMDQIGGNTVHDEINLKQPKTLATPITIGGVSQTTAEGALGALNTTKAERGDISSISCTGSTNDTGSTITAGTYFYLNSVLCKALADIADDAAFTLNTNYKVVTTGEELTALNSKSAKTTEVLISPNKMTMWRMGDLRVIVINGATAGNVNSIALNPEDSPTQVIYSSICTLTSGFGYRYSKPGRIFDTPVNDTSFDVTSDDATDLIFGEFVYIV